MVPTIYGEVIAIIWLALYELYIIQCNSCIIWIILSAYDQNLQSIFVRF